VNILAKFFDEAPQTIVVCLKKAQRGFGLDGPSLKIYHMRGHPIQPKAV
jgi:hypothetical protein